MTPIQGMTDRDLLRECLAALNDIPRTRFRQWFQQKHGLKDTYALASKLDRHLAAPPQQEGCQP
ncbi:MAG: cobalamin biosynthesis protein CbiX [Bryobacteraceae bacterium]